jgi:hypothetical protein
MSSSHAEFWCPIDHATTGAIVIVIELKERLTKDPMTPSITINNLAPIITILGDYRVSFFSVRPSVVIPNVVMPSAFVMRVVAPDLD